MGSGGRQFRYSWSGTQAYFVIGIVLVLLGLLFLSPVVRWIITAFGYIFIVLGAIAIVLGIINWLSDLRRRQN